MSDRFMANWLARPKVRHGLGYLLVASVGLAFVAARIFLPPSPGNHVLLVLRHRHHLLVCGNWTRRSLLEGQSFTDSSALGTRSHGGESLRVTDFLKYQCHRML